jgi:hypothetical protein
VVIYFYAILKDYGGGSQVRENTWYNPLATEDRALGTDSRIRGRAPQAVSVEDRSL